MIADIWKTEYHVIDASGSAVDWLEDKDEAIAQAKTLGGSVERVISFLDDRKTVWPSVDHEDDGY